MSFNLGNVIKYVWRADDKGKQLQDLEKAKWYLEDEITRLRADQLTIDRAENLEGYGDE